MTTEYDIPTAFLTAPFTSYYKEAAEKAHKNSKNGLKSDKRIGQKCYPSTSLGARDK